MTAALSLGPVFFHWPPQCWRDFYFRLAEEAPIDAVYLGEVVCAKRIPFTAPEIEAVLSRLKRGGKRVFLSSLALIGNEREAALMRDLCAEVEATIEANDVGLLDLVAGRPHVLGPFLNIYNESTLSYFAAKGAVGACLPAELPGRSLARLAATAPIPLEVHAFGRLPLAISARCFHARAQRLHKDGCQFVCGRDQNGLVVNTLEGEPFLAVNGLQTLSYTCLNLLGEVKRLEAAGISGFRLLPLAVDMVAVARLFREVLDGVSGAEEASSRLEDLVPGIPFANGFLYGAAGRSRQSALPLELE